MQVTLGPIGETLRNKLERAFSPHMLDVIDESDLHAGHAGAHPRGESHFRVTIVSAAFAGKPRIERQRMVHAIVESELSDRVHALSIQALSPDEASKPR